MARQKYIIHLQDEMIVLETASGWALAEAPAPTEADAFADAVRRVCKDAGVDPASVRPMGNVFALPTRHGWKVPSTLSEWLGG